jgi:hypothetical protein
MLELWFRQFIDGARAARLPSEPLLRSTGSDARALEPRVSGEAA